MHGSVDEDATSRRHFSVLRIAEGSSAASRRARFSKSHGAKNALNLAEITTLHVSFLPDTKHFLSKHTLGAKIRLSKPFLSLPQDFIYV